MKWKSALAAFALLLSIGGAHAPFAIFQTYNTSSTCPDAPPIVAQGFGMNTCVFFDSMTSLATVDVNMTNAAPSTGINWYTEEPAGFASYSATISGTTMTAGTPMKGSITVGQTIGYGGDTCTPTPGTKITGLGTGSGGAGTYTISPSQICSGTVISSFAQAASTLSANGSGLTISNVSQAFDNFGIASGTYLNNGNGTGAAVWRGTIFRASKGYVVRAYYSYDNSLAPAIATYGLTNLRWPAFWTTTQLGVPVSSPYTYEYVESDICDCFPTVSGGSTNLNNFVYDEGSGGTFASNNFGSGGDYANICNPVFDGNTFHTIDFLWVPTTLNSGAGMFAYLIDEDTCPGNAVFNGSINTAGSVYTLTVNSIVAGSLKVGSYVTGNGVDNHSKITALGTGTGGTGTYILNNGNDNVTNITMVASDQNNCTYYQSPGVAGCQTQGFAGAYAIAENEDQGFSILITSGCTNYWSDPTMPPTTTSTACNGATGSWPLHVKNVQVWCIDLTCKRVQN